jgi:hypothetical protein
MASATPATGLHAEFLEEIAFYEQRYMRLAEAMPAEKYTWRPFEGVRSVSEVFTHYRGKLWHCRGTGYRPTGRHRSQGHHGPLR